MQRKVEIISWEVVALAESSFFMGDVCSKTVYLALQLIWLQEMGKTLLSSPKHSAANQPGCAAAAGGFLIESCSFTQF